MADSLRFLHGADFHLDRPLVGLKEIPSHLKSTLANAPYHAAEKFFDLALREHVDFVLLAGDIVNLDRGGPRAAAFLLSQFERLAEKGIEVYWCAGDDDHPDRWPAAIELPSNVITFSATVVDRISHVRRGKPVATIFGCGFDGKKRSNGEFRAEAEDPFPIALCHGELENSNLGMYRVRYWALGGQHRRQLIDKGKSIAAYPGTLQGRSPLENYAGGATLCRVDLDGTLTTQAVELDTVRWSQQTIGVAESIGEEDLQNLLADRALKLSSDAPEQLLLVHWKMTTTGDFNPLFRKQDWQASMMKWLRQELGQDGQRGVWSARFEVQSPKSLPGSWYEEDTILGDYLRSVARYHADDSIHLGLQDLMPANLQDDSLAAVARIDRDRREAILQEAALIGVDYLSQHDSYGDDD